jgi:hypothetical protein
MVDSFYIPLAPGRFSSTSATVGPWDPHLCHGSPPATLLLRAIERAFPRDDARVGRIAVDFFGPVPAAEVTLSTEMVRPGQRIELARARLAAGGKTAMEATAWRIAAQPSRAPAVVDPRRPPALPPAPQTNPFFDAIPFFGYGRALEWRFAEGSFVELGPAAVYTRPLIPLVPGEELSPLGRLMLMVDSANGISSALPLGEYLYVPVELTVSVRRHPRTEWVGMRAETNIESDGVGQTRAELFDEEGYLGLAIQTLFVARRGA